MCRGHYCDYYFNVMNYDVMLVIFVVVVNLIVMVFVIIVQGCICHG